MTGVQLIVPLDEDEQDLQPKNGTSKTARQQDTDTTSNPKPEEEKKDDDDGDEKSSAVLSDELREQFETMKAVWRQARRPSADDLGAEADASEAAAVQVDEEELRRKQRETAVETALAVDAEIARWKNGISELEAMLAADDNGSFSDESSLEQEGVEQHQNQGQENAAHRPRRQLLPNRHDPQHQEAHPLIRFPNLPPVVLDDDDDCNSSDA